MSFLMDEIFTYELWRVEAPCARAQRRHGGVHAAFLLSPPPLATTEAALREGRRAFSPRRVGARPDRDGSGTVGGIGVDIGRRLERQVERGWRRRAVGVLTRSASPLRAGGTRRRGREMASRREGGAAHGAPRVATGAL